MSRTERRVNELVEDDEEMAEAIAAVKRVAEDNGGTVEWSDVSDDITSGQWGRINQENIVVSTDDGKLELADPEAIEAALSDEGVDVDGDVDVDLEIDLDEDPPESDGWSRWDKIAAVGVAVVMSGYAFGPARQVIEGVVNPILVPLDEMLPFYVVIMIIAIATATYSTLLQANLMNTEVIQYQQKRMQAFRERQKEVEEHGDEAAQEKMQQKQMEMMGDNLGMFKEQFKPTVYIMLLTIPAFLWLLSAVNQGTIVGPEPSSALETGDVVMPLQGAVTWSEGILGPFQAWILWYILCSIAFGQIIRKAINVDFSPT